MEKCSFRTDEAFCNERVRGIMKRRRRHLECRREQGGCLVVYGTTCQTGLLPAWFKEKIPRRRKAVKTMESWGKEG
ncbi:hypothetical protein N7535_000377 [Penicillium sp. DV-2018c]|nr:hypothetical protein N7461_006377 [Penicillium sp. DV-2018c]KAJ5581757.1 hypothetical protein N7535_000377 [Penicillium sp. DV-2018c]